MRIILDIYTYIYTLVIPIIYYMLICRWNAYGWQNANGAFRNSWNDATSTAHGDSKSAAEYVLSAGNVKALRVLVHFAQMLILNF